METVETQDVTVNDLPLKIKYDTERCNCGSNCGNLPSRLLKQ